MKEIEKISPLKESEMLYRVKAKLAEEQFNIQNRNIGLQALESLYRFLLGSVAGGWFIFIGQSTCFVCFI